MFLIVGLGNPSSDYSKTRHNIGFMVLDHIAKKHKFVFEHKSKFNSEIALGSVEGVRVALCKPDTFMNLSGKAVQPIMSFYKILPANLIVIHDDIDLVTAEIKYKFAGSAAGHNGLRSIDQHIGQNYHRIRVGIGRPAPQHDVASYVLSNFSNDELSAILAKFTDIENRINSLLKP